MRLILAGAFVVLLLFGAVALLSGFAAWMQPVKSIPPFTPTLACTEEQEMVNGTFPLNITVTQQCNADKLAYVASIDPLFPSFDSYRADLGYMSGSAFALATAVLGMERRMLPKGRSFRLPAVLKLLAVALSFGFGAAFLFVGWLSLTPGYDAYASSLFASFMGFYGGHLAFLGADPFGDAAVASILAGSLCFAALRFDTGVLAGFRDSLLFYAAPLVGAYEAYLFVVDRGDAGISVAGFVYGSPFRWVLTNWTVLFAAWSLFALGASLPYWGRVLRRPNHQPALTRGRLRPINRRPTRARANDSWHGELAETKLPGADARLETL